MSRIGRLGGKSSAGRRQSTRSDGAFPGTTDNDGGGNGNPNGNGHAPDRVAGQADDMAAESPA